MDLPTLGRPISAAKPDLWPSGSSSSQAGGDHAGVLAHGAAAGFGQKLLNQAHRNLPLMLVASSGSRSVIVLSITTMIPFTR